MTQYVDVQYIRGALGITGTKESCKGCKYNEPEGFACNTYKAPSFAYVCEVLDDAPTVDAEPVRHGKWINCGTYDQGYQVTLECGCCGEAVNGYVHDYKYCPYCGAKMEAYEEEENKEEEDD